MRYHEIRQWPRSEKGHYVATEVGERCGEFGRLLGYPVPPENSIRATHRGSGPTPDSFFSLASTDSVPSTGDACAGDVANVCQRVESGCYDPGSAIGQSGGLFGSERPETRARTATRAIRGYRMGTSSGNRIPRWASGLISHKCRLDAARQWYSVLGWSHRGSTVPGGKVLAASVQL